MMLRELMQLQHDQDILFGDYGDGSLGELQKNISKRSEYIGGITMLFLLSDHFGVEFLEEVKDAITAEQFLNAFGFKLAYTGDTQRL